MPNNEPLAWALFLNPKNWAAIFLPINLEFVTWLSLRSV